MEQDRDAERTHAPAYCPPPLGDGRRDSENFCMDIHSFGRTPREADRLYRKQVERAWVALVDGRSNDIDPNVRDLVRDSWLRCLAMGVEPLGQRPLRRAGGNSLEALRDANADLLRAFQNTWRVLGDILSDTQSCLIVADAAGTMLDICGSPTVLERGARECVSPGYAWSEQSGGTNAIGTAIARNAPAEVHSAEHLLSVAKLWSCSAAPVRDSIDGKLLGVVDVTSFGESHQQHCLALAVTAAHQIEETLHSRELARSVQLLHWYQLQAGNHAHQAVVLLDRKGRVLTANDLARALFANCRDCTPLERGQTFVSWQANGTSPFGVPPELTLEHCTAVLPPRTRLVGLEPWGGRNRGWEGGLLVLEPTRETRRPAATAATTTMPDAFAALLGQGVAMQEARRKAARLARAVAPVLIEGEPGTGKALFAQAMHRASGVSAGPWVTLQCQTLEPTDITRVLFGEGTTAIGGCPGKLEEADGGTLFIDEVALLPTAAQLGLLRLLHENVVMGTGGFPERRVHVRVLAATARDLAAEVAAGRFRLDLYQRLKVLSLPLPSLRERREDFPALIDRLLAELEASHGLGVRRATPALAETLAAQTWPGNLDELRSVLEQMYVLSDAETLDVADLPAERAVGAAKVPAEDDAPQSISGLERAAIESELARHGDNLSAVARRLGISRSTLYRKLKRYGLA